MANPNVCVLKTDGINCDMEMAYAFEVAGGFPELVHVNQLRTGDRNLNDFGMLAIPGGFSYGDDVASGKILATELTSYLTDQLQAFVEQEKPVLGICNGFQVLVRTGLLPSGEVGEQIATLTDNESGRFECRWIDLEVGSTACRFIQPGDVYHRTVPMQTAHAEGRFFTDDETLQGLKDNYQVAFRYVAPDGLPANGYPDNPNGALDDIAGICNPSGTVLGMMPHPERSIGAFHPNRSRTEAARFGATTLFRNIVDYARSI